MNHFKHLINHLLLTERSKREIVKIQDPCAFHYSAVIKTWSLTTLGTLCSK